MRFHGRWLRLLLIPPLYVLTMVLVHEMGHAWTIGHIPTVKSSIYIWPGYQVYPQIGMKFPEAWPEKTVAFTYVALYSKFKPDGSDPLKHQGLLAQTVGHLALLAGSGATSLLSLLSLFLMSLFRPKGLCSWVLVAGSLMHLDMLTYTVFPVFFNVRHLILWAGEIPEPVEALFGLGVSRGFSVTAIILLSLVQFFWLYHLLLPKPAPNK